MVALTTALLAAAAPAGAATTVPACEGTTEYALTPSLLELTGTREAELNSGASVPLYLADGRIASPGNDPVNSGRVPGCVAYRDGDDTIKSVWAYCTDHQDTSSCMATWLPSPMTVTGNPKFLASFDPLGPDKERVIGFLAVHGYPLRNGNAVSYANDATTASREALQKLIWCVSDAGVGNKVTGGCGVNFTAADFDTVLGLVDSTPVLEVTAPDGPLTVGDVARFTVETNVTGKPIALTRSGGEDWRVCAGDAILSGDQLTVPATGVWGQTVTVELCAATAAEGTVKLDALVFPDAKKDLAWIWNGSPACQVFVKTTPGKSWWGHQSADQVTVEAAEIPTTPTEPTTPTTPTEPTTPSAPTTPTTPSAPTEPVVAAAQVERISTLRVTKTSARSRYAPGQRVTYRIRVTNPSSRVARNVRVCDTMPRGLVFVSASPKARLSNGQHCWTVKTLGAKKSASFRIVARVAGNAPSRVTNRVTASSRDVRRTATAKRTVRIERAVAKAGGVTG